MDDLFGNDVDKKVKHKDWSGNARSMFVCNGDRNFAKEDRQANDYYATSPASVRALLDVENFSHTVYEPCVGGGHIAGEFLAKGHNVIAADIVDRGFPNTKIQDFLDVHEKNSNDIVTNPPYALCKEFAEHALDISENGTKIAMFLKLSFMESQKRRELFDKYPFKVVYVFSNRQSCAKDGDFDKYPSSAIAYGWFVWEKGFKGDPIIKWI